MGADGRDEPTFGGLTLEQHAGVTAAVAEGIDLDEVLGQEQIEAWVWRGADPAWKRALAESTELQLRYLCARRQAEDALARDIGPFAREPAAWAALLGAVAAADDATEVLAPYRLSRTPKRAQPLSRPHDCASDR